MNKKIGLDYFPFDIDFFIDDKIQFISALFGTKGEAIAVRLLCKIYRQGYFLEWTEDAALLFAKSVGDGCKPSFVNEVIDELVRRDFFHKNIFKQYSVLTSKGIQRRFFEAVSRRKEVEVFLPLILVKLDKLTNLVEIPTFNNQNVNISKSDDDILKQRKGEESKGEERTVNILSKDNNIESPLNKAGDTDLESSELPSRISYKKISDLFMQLCPRLPIVRMITDKRKAAIKPLYLKYGFDGFEEVFQKLGTSDFCCGINERNWKADFDWVLKPNNWAKVIEGKYDNKPAKSGSTQMNLPKGITGVLEM